MEKNVKEVNSGNYKRFKIRISGREYEMRINISYFDLLQFETICVTNADYKKAFCEMVLRKLIVENRVVEEKPNFIDIEKDIDEIREDIFDEFFKYEDRLKIEYENLTNNIVDPYQSFVQAIVQCHSGEQKAFLDTIAKAEEFLSPVSSNLNEALGTVANYMDRIQKQMDYVFSNLKPFLIQFAESINALASKIKITQYTEEQVQEILLNHEQWGNFGWTLMPAAPLNFFYTCPNSMKEANAKALAYCRDRDMQELFSLMRHEKQIKQSDLEEAIFCFENKKWRACALILFGLIDAKLIRLQKVNINKKQRRSVGKSAAEKVMDELQKKHESELTLLYLGKLKNIFACCIKMFENGNDFKIQPLVINRNFLDHGMLTVRVRRKDCVQIFLLYYNLIDFLNMIRFLESDKR